MWAAAVAAVLVAACAPVSGPPTPEPTPQSPEAASAAVPGESPNGSIGDALRATVVPSSASTTSPAPAPKATVAGVPVRGVVSHAGRPLAYATVTAGEHSVITGPDGAFAFPATTAQALSVSRPGFVDAAIEVPPGGGVTDVLLEPFVVRALRVSSVVAKYDQDFANLLNLAATTPVNTLVFDTKDETGYVLYQSTAPAAVELGFIKDIYDPEARLAQAKAAGLYTVTRIVTFEDVNWSAARPEHRLALTWMNPISTAAWEYPLQLATEACALGFDEIQFDYVRFPAGRSATIAQQVQPLTAEQRVAAIVAFLTEAGNRLHPMGCALSADIFGIVMSSPDDQGLGQRPEELSGVVDALSPMLYPSHYSPGWLGYPDPNEEPAAVIADALDDGMPRMTGGAVTRPWLQAFYYDGDQIKAQIAEAEARGAGWILWNASGYYEADWLPLDTPHREAWDYQAGYRATLCDNGPRSAPRHTRCKPRDRRSD